MEKGQNRKAKTHEDLEVYQIAFDAAMRIFELSKKFPVEEKYSLTDQIRRSSRSVCANLAVRVCAAWCKAAKRSRRVAWRKRRYKAAFIAKLSDCEAEAAEVQVWLKFAVKCSYLDVELGRDIYATYNQILGSLVKIINNPEPKLL
ncbi:MAG: four helix bundle protein [Coleofasciculaceae cyanobacterium]